MYKRQTFAKRATKYGPGGPGAVYATTPDGKTAVFATVPEAGDTPHENTLADGRFYGVPGTQSLGDLDISEDGSELYVVNLNNRRLYVYDATGATAAAPKASYAIPDPGCPSPDDWRPGGLGVHDVTVYVGGVCSGQSTKRLSDVRVAVHAFRDGAFAGSPVLVQTLDFPRGQVYSGVPEGSDRWNPWTDSWADTAKPNDRHLIHPQPLLTDIGVEPNGDLVLGFRDRYGDMSGANLPAPDGSDGYYSSMSGGDLNRACAQPDGTFAWEGTGTCPNNVRGDNGGPQPGGVKEYYPGDHLTTVHMETAQGAFALVYSAERMPATVMDPISISTGGVGWFDRSNGLVDGNAYQLTNSWGKSNGLADLEAICDLAPVQIGNRVWFDANGNGVQDAGEPPLPGVKVSLLSCTGGAPIAVKTTDANGEYYFGVADKLTADTCYRVVFDYSTADTSGLPGKPPKSQLAWTRSTAGGDRCVDSNVDPKTGQAEVTVGRAGSVDHCVDAGVRRLNRLGDLVWVDVNRDGVQGDDEPGVPGVRVVVRDATGAVVGHTTTDDNGNYLFDNLPDGTYTVCFDRTSLPERYAEYQLTKQLVGAPDQDSDADPATWCTGPVTLGPDNPEDLTLDAGIVEPRNRLGDLVWEDRNGNGVQDPDEPGVSGVRVTVRDVVTGEQREVRTDAKGRYLFDDLPDGTYQVCVDRSTLPAAFASHQFTDQDAGADDAADSDVAPATGCIPEVKLGPGNRENLTLDAGIYRAADGGGAVPPPNAPPANSPPQYVQRPPGGLASTGATVGLLTVLGALVVAAGVTLLVVSRRRKRKTRAA